LSWRDHSPFPVLRAADAVLLICWFRCPRRGRDSIALPNLPVALRFALERSFLFLDWPSAKDFITQRTITFVRQGASSKLVRNRPDDSRNLSSIFRRADSIGAFGYARNCRRGSGR
jgi:hypothetical protein